MKHIYDVVVIGAGNGGLVAGTRLAMTGKKVLILEKHNIPGGFATSFVRGRFEFEASLHELCDFGPENNKGSLRILFDELGITDKIEWVEVHNAYRVINIDDTNMDYTMPFGRKKFIDKMEHYVKGSQESINDFFNLADEILLAMGYLGRSRGKPDSKVLKKEFPNFMRVAAYSVDDVFKALSIPKLAQDILSTYWVYLGSHIGDLSFVHFALMTMLYIDLGAFIPKMRSHEISLAIETRFRELGGEIWYNSEVDKILLNNNEVEGIRLIDGTIVYSNHIISNTSPHNVFGNMIDNVPVQAKKLTNARTLAARGFSIFLGLNKDAKELGLNDHSYFLGKTLDSKIQYESMKDFENISHIAVCLNNVIEDCSPKGTSILYFTTLYFSDCFGEIKEEDYFDMKNKLAEKFLLQFEKTTGIKIMDCIEEIEIATPMTYARYTNAPDGSIYGYKAHSWDNMMPRLMRMYDEN
ncbi:MAG: NAD(P)/FAD-dependent oxidoreductase, partial [Oscillospiraceae bacterium]